MRPIMKTSIMLGFTNDESDENNSGQTHLQPLGQLQLLPDELLEPDDRLPDDDPDLEPEEPD